MISLSHKILIGRVLTRSGDQAWDFAVPLVLLKLLPGELRVAALYYLLVRLALVVILPRFTSAIDQMNRFKAAKLGIFTQLIGVLMGFGAISSLSNLEKAQFYLGNGPAMITFVVLVVGGILSSLGGSFMDIAIANDLVPSSLGDEDLASFNSRLRQVDLLTELAAPVLAGLLLVLDWGGLTLFGFAMIALWNFLSFFPEYGLLKSIFKSRPDLLNKEIKIDRSVKIPFLKRLHSGWRDFFKEPVALAVLSYAILWLSVLSPHGVLLTAFLKDAWALPEWEIGLFRGAGAFFGLGATILFPKVISKMGLIKGSQIFLMFQALMVLLALVSFVLDSRLGQIGFLGFILLSRVGLYGFSLGEMQIRQQGIRPEARGQVNGFASALTGLATLGLFGASAFLPSTNDFSWLIGGSVVCVCAGAGVYSYWVRVHRSVDVKISF